VTLLEIALADVAGAGIAERAGAARIELCAGLSDGGTTPSIGLVRQASAQLFSTTLMVLIRPRAGDFVYTADEVRVMRADIEAIRAAAPAAGFVIGALEPSGEVDLATISVLLADCEGAPVTFNKAFDSTPDIARSLDILIGLGVDRVLTSGGRRTALDGAAEIRGLIEQAAGRITMVAGGSVRADTVCELVANTGVTEVHLRAAIPRFSKILWSNPEQDYGNAVVSATDDATVRDVLRALTAAGS
jgi:copper homeostasis protein